MNIKRLWSTLWRFEGINIIFIIMSIIIMFKNPAIAIPFLATNLAIVLAFITQLIKRTKEEVIIKNVFTIYYFIFCVSVVLLIIQIDSLAIVFLYMIANVLWVCKFAKNDPPDVI